MAELREVFEMVTKQTEPDLDSWKQQKDRQRRTSRNRKFGALAVAAVIAVAAVVVVIRAVNEPTEPQPGGQSTTQPTEPIGSITDGSLMEPGRYVIETYDPAFNASHRITLEVPDGYQGYLGSGVLTLGGTIPGLMLYDIGSTFADVCDWRGAQTPISSGDELAATLAGEQGLSPTVPTDVAVSGFAGRYMEITAPSQTELDRCSSGRMQAWATLDDGHIWLNNAGQHDLLWILDVDGVPLVIDAQLPPSASAQDRAELEQMVESIRIERT
jgi:hypothetical protein